MGALKKREACTIQSVYHSCDIIKNISSEGGFAMQQRILTGDRPTGKLHLGHYVGSLLNRVNLQNDYETLILIADIQALTTHFEKPELINDSIYQVTIDNLSVGLNPENVRFVQQSQVKAIAELTVMFSMLITVNSLRHNPTIKTEAKQYNYNDLTYGFLGYPVSQSADIIFCNADLVPVGDDQLPHIEVAHKLVRRFNDLYQTDVLKEPKALLSNYPRLAGLDGNSKMGKSLNNAIYLSDTAEIVADKIKVAKTDINRIRINDLGNPDVCVVSTYQKIFNQNEYENICEMCKTGKIGCTVCKKNLISALNQLLDPIREKEEYYSHHKSEVRDILQTGSDHANVIGEETMVKIKEVMKIAL